MQLCIFLCFSWKNSAFFGENSQGAPYQNVAGNEEGTLEFLCFHCKFEHCWGRIDRGQTSKRLEFSMLFIEKAKIFRGQFRGGSLAKRCRNQKEIMQFFCVFHGKIQHFSVKIPRGYPINMLQEMRRKQCFFVLFIANLNIFWAKLIRGRRAKCCRNQAGTLGFSMLFIEKFRIFR